MSPTIYKRGQTLAVTQMTLLPLELKTGPSGEACGMVLKDLLCGEALSPNTHCPTRVGGLLHDDCNAPRWLAMIRPLSPSHNHLRSSLPSKIGEHISPCYIHHHTLPFCADDITMTSARRDNPTLGQDKAGHDAIAVADLIISRPTLAELGEAMRTLQEREAQKSYRLSDHYIDTLLGFGMAGSSFVEVFSVRRDGVFLIFKLVEALRLRKLIAAHAIAYLDRFLNNLPSTLVKSTVDKTSATQFRYIATACVSIAAKLDDSAAPSLASLGRVAQAGERRIRDMEAVVLQVLGWKLLGVTTSDFVDTMLAHLPLSGVPSALVQRARRRADQLIQAILTEVEFLDFEQSIISLCVMQCILDETLPLQAALLMAALRAFLVVDTLAAQQCYKLLMDLVAETLPRCSTTSPGGILQHSTQSDLQHTVSAGA